MRIIFSGTPEFAVPASPPLNQHSGLLTGLHRLPASGYLVEKQEYRHLMPGS
jgi:hypothetical protein